MARIRLSPLLANVSGSVGRSTFQKSLGGITLRAKPLLSSGYSFLQQVSKTYMSIAVQAWHSLSESNRLLWNQYANYNPAFMRNDRSRSLSGYNLFVKYNCIRLAAGLSVLELTDFVAPDALDIDPRIYIHPQSMYLVGNYETPAVYYSYDRTAFSEVDVPPPFHPVRGFCFANLIWYCFGEGASNIALSLDGLTWEDVTETPFGTACFAMCWNGTLYVAGGSGGNTLAYSYNGTDWTGLGDDIFTTECRSVCWNGTVFIAGGSGGNTLAYSYNGIDWYGLGNSMFNLSCRSVCWNGTFFIAGGTSNNIFAKSTNGIDWTPISSSVFLVTLSVCWNGTVFVAGGSGPGNTLAYSHNGTDWTGLGLDVFYDECTSIVWDGLYFLATGHYINDLAQSKNGITWTTVSIQDFEGHLQSAASVPAPLLVPSITQSLNFSFSNDIQGYDQFALLKLSLPVRETSAYRASRLRVIVLEFGCDPPFDITSQYFSLFHRIPIAGDYVDCSIILFSLSDCKLFPEKVYRLTVE
jgi:hypothetical protein